ncbi:MAG: HEAT repeat domain-containing protein [Kaiparowitsia implicata GSE-PSE-MK54-09C]|jgi:phycocyanobilin lyase alpha subunit|nr:HEAT repeat domain-containing protein [Kaiparowitsia implicata GSE-PSE-MK54-09C]
MQEPSLESNTAQSLDPSGQAGAPPLTVEGAIAQLTGDDPSLRYYAAWWLGKFRVSEPGVVTALIAALEDDSDRTELGGYPLRRNAARALGKLGDERAVPGLLRCLDCSDFYVRESAAQSLGMLGDRRAIPPLLALIQDGMAVAQRVPGRPHLVQPVESILEALGALGATEALPLVQLFLEHPLQRLQYSAVRAMYQLTGKADYGDRLVQALHSSDINLRRVALSDLGAVGYLPAAGAIASAAAENSFKLFSLKGLLDAAVATEGASSEAAQQVMALMDQLL